MNIIKYKKFYFLISLLILIPGILAITFWHLRLGIDFTGGTVVNFALEKSVDTSQVREKVLSLGYPLESIQSIGSNEILLRLKPQTQEEINSLKNSLSKDYGKITEQSLETVGPTISGEITQNAIKSVVFACIAIVLYIIWAFRQVPKPTTSVSFGVAVVIALFHDLLVVIGVFAILGHFFGAEIDTLFVTALLTVLGFSVHDTIVVFDRIRENLKKHASLSFEEVVNRSLTQTLGRSLSTSLTVLFVLIALVLFSGGSIKWFAVALLVGIISGTYSSIFNAAPILVVWNERFINKNKN